jgi:hypothetical protein
MRPRITVITQTIRSIREREQKFTALVKYECKDNPQLTWHEAKQSVKNSIRFGLMRRELSWIQ